MSALSAYTSELKKQVSVLSLKACPVTLLPGVRLRCSPARGLSTLCAKSLTPLVRDVVGFIQGWIATSTRCIGRGSICT